MAMSFFIEPLHDRSKFIITYRFYLSSVGLLCIFRGKCLFRYGLGTAFTRQY